MSYTLETKKRKFHRVLDSISNPTAPASSTSPSTPERATAHSTTSTPKRPRLYSGLSTTSSPARTPAYSPSSATDGGKPHYVPWSRPRFLARLRTFRRVDRWTPKPAPINEVAWAKKGWECVGVQTVGCVGGCGKEVVVKIPDEVDIPESNEGAEGQNGEEGGGEEDDEDWGIRMMERREVLEKLVKEYEKQMIVGHAEKCAWRVKGCDDTIQHLPLTKPDVAVAGFKQRYLGLLAAQLNLPDSNQIATPIEDSSIEEVVKILPDDFTQSPPSSDTDKENDNAADATTITTNASEHNHTINISALKLALLGWESDPDSPSLDVITCGACFRRLGLWMYTRKPSSSSQAKEEDEEEDIEATTLNSASEHQEYCPWINRHTQSCDASGKITNLSKISPARPGWEVLLQDIRIMHRRLLWSGPAKASHRDVPMDAGDVEEDEEERKKRDREWWSKIQRLRQVLKVKGLKRENATARGVDSRASSVSRDSVRP